MTIALALDNIRWPLFRVLTRPNWGGGSNPSQCSHGWTQQPVAKRGRRGTGFTVERFSRRCLPEIGEALLSVEFGLIGGQMIFVDPTTAARAAAGTAWEPDVDSLTVPDLKDHIVVVQVAENPGDDSATTASLTWTTSFVGYVAYQEDTGWPGASLPTGRRDYYLFDLLHRTANWQLNRHGFIATDEGGSDVAWPSDNANGDPVIGHPGYNLGEGANVAKTRDQSTFKVNGQDCYYHVWPNSARANAVTAGYWTDQEAVNDSLTVVRPADEPHFQLAAAGVGALDALSQATSAWEVNDNEDVHTFICRVLDRRRGRGVAYLDWTTSSSGESLGVTVSVKVSPQFYDNLHNSYDDSDIRGAHSAGTVYGASETLDLIGDHRLVEGSFSIGDRNQNRYERVVSEGEPIEIAVTLSTRDGNSGSTEALKVTKDGTTLARRWSATEQTTFNGLALTARGSTKYDHIYTTYGLPRGWTGLGGDGNGGTPYRIDYRTDDDGTVTVPSLGSRPDTPPHSVEILHDLPFLEGWTYTAATPARVAGDELGEPKRRQPVIYIRKSAEHFVSTRDQDEHESHHLNIYKDGLKVSHGAEAGSRPIGNTFISPTSRYNHQDMAITVALRLPHRVHFATGPADAKRVLTIRHKNKHLWLAAANCIWSLTQTSGVAATGYAPVRSAGGGTSSSPGLIRDDRLALAVLHRLAVAWYTTDHLPCSWALKACGFLPSFTSDDVTVAYPTIGQLVYSLAANGQVQIVSTPITGVDYDNRSGVTTWRTDWGTLDFA